MHSPVAAVWTGKNYEKGNKVYRKGKSTDHKAIEVELEDDVVLPGDQVIYQLSIIIIITKRDGLGIRPSLKDRPQQ